MPNSFFNDIWQDIESSSFEIRPYLDVETILNDTYCFSIDKYGIWNEDRALKEGEFENNPETIENFDASFERVIDIISTYPEEEKNILMGILAKGLSDESGSLQIFGTFYKKMESVHYKSRLTSVLGIVESNRT